MGIENLYGWDAYLIFIFLFKSVTIIVDDNYFSIDII